MNVGIVDKGVSGTDTFTVTNTGSGTLSVSDITSSNAQFTVSPTHFDLTAGESQTVTVTFTPTVVGWEQSTLAMTHNAEGSPTPVTANGIGKIDINVPKGDLANTWIAFTSNRDGNPEIYVMNYADKTGTPINLTNHTAMDHTPVWSPDGKQIAFVSDREGSQEIYIMDVIIETDLVKSGQVRRLTFSHPLMASDPAWSPDGTKIVFTVGDQDDNQQLYMMNADGAGTPVNLSAVSGRKIDFRPSWSPDGTQIAFQSFTSGNRVWVMDADGQNGVQLTTFGGQPHWSPDGTQIAFSEGGTTYVMNANGTNQTPLASASDSDAISSWSPDGTKVAFDSRRDGRYQVYVMDADGENEERLTSNIANDNQASWSPFLSSPPPLIGDANNDGQINEADAAWVLQAVVGLRLVSPADLQRCDVTGNGTCSALDAALILQYTVGIITRFPVEEGVSVSPPLDATATKGALRLGWVAAKPGERLSLPIDLVKGNALLGGSFRIIADPSLVKIHQVRRDVHVVGSRFDDGKTHGRTLLVTHVDSPGSLTVTFGRSEAIQAGQPLAVIEMEVLPTASLNRDSVSLRIEDVTFNEGIKAPGTFGDIRLLPHATALLPNYPNPFNPETWIPYQLASGASVAVEIYSIGGQLVRTVDLGFKPAGFYRTRERAAHWDGRNDVGERVASGVYFYRLTAGDFAAARKMVILK